MRLSDLLHPERIIAFSAKAFAGLLALILVRELIVTWLSQHQFSAGELLAFCICLVAASPIAYLVREHRRRSRPTRPEARRGAERKPVLPPGGSEP